MNLDNLGLFNILCNNDKEFKELQVVLLRYGYRWFDSGNKVLDMPFGHQKIYVYNILNSEKILWSTLVGNHGKKYDYNSFKKFIRNIKLEKINNGIECL